MNTFRQILRIVPPLRLAMLVLLPTLSVRANSVSEDTLKAAVQTWVRKVTADARPDATVAAVEPYMVDGQTAAYIVRLAGGGFCLCGADDALLPVYLYSPQGTYDPDNPDYRYILQGIAERLATSRDRLKAVDDTVPARQAALADRVAFWQNLAADRLPTAQRQVDSGSPPVMMTLPVTSHWHQNSPYNDQCPELTPGADEHAVTGCVATASAQIMYYWRWPPTGVGTGSVDYNWRYRTDWASTPLATDPNIPSSWSSWLRWRPDNGGELLITGYWDGSVYDSATHVAPDSPGYLDALETLYGGMTQETTICSANFGATAYDWALMADSHTDPVDPGDVQAAQLCYHVGVALGMGYGVFGSSNHTLHAADALPDHFQYDGDAVFNSRSVDTMTTEIQWLRPVQLGGQQPGVGGHSWVVCGYNMATDPDRQFLMNLGGGNTDWYTCDEQFPDDQGHTTRIAPRNVVKFVGGSSGGDGSPGSPYENAATAAANYPDGATLIFKAGSINTFTGGPVVFDRPCTLKGYDVVIGEAP